jgi:hypothetical protein
MKTGKKCIYKTKVRETAEMGSITFNVINYNYRLHRSVWLQLQLRLHPFSNVIDYNYNYFEM